MTAPTSTEVRARLVETLRRDLIGPGPQDSDLARERLKEKPSGWYVTGYLAPVPEPSGPPPRLQKRTISSKRVTRLSATILVQTAMPVLRARPMTPLKTCLQQCAFARRRHSA